MRIPLIKVNVSLDVWDSEQQDSPGPIPLISGYFEPSKDGFVWRNSNEPHKKLTELVIGWAGDLLVHGMRTWRSVKAKDGSGTYTQAWFSNEEYVGEYTPGGSDEG